MTRNGLIGALVISVFLTCGAAFAQETAANPAFEVATIKPSSLDMMKIMTEVRSGKVPAVGSHIDGALARYTYVTLRDLVVIAYGVKPFQITGPAWLTADHFDIVAKIPDGVSKDVAPKMLQSLLQDRFKLVAHREDNEGPVLALVVGKDGPKLKESPAVSVPIDVNIPLKPGETRIDSPNGPVVVKKNADGSTTMNMGNKGTMTVRVDPQAQTMTYESSNLTMAGFADILTTVLRAGGENGRQVLDMTGLKGNYQVSLTLSMAALMQMARAQGAIPPPASAGSANWGEAPGAAASEPSAGDATIFDSVKRLGLKLEPRNAKVEELVIDHIEKTPTEN